MKELTARQQDKARLLADLHRQYEKIKEESAGKLHRLAGEIEKVRNSK